MPKKVSPGEKRSKTISVLVTAEEYEALRALSWLTNKTVSAILYEGFKPFVEELLERHEIQKAMRLGKPLVALPTKEEIELRELASWLEKDRLAR